MNANETTKFYQTLRVNDDGNLSVQAVLDMLARHGIQKSDPRLDSLARHSHFVDNQLPIDARTFHRLFNQSMSLIHRALGRDFVIPGFDKFSNEVADIFSTTANNTEGEVATYIPQLAQVDPKHFAVSICTIDGQQFMLGDEEIPFCFQSTCKPILYSAAMDLQGEKAVHRHIGWESSGKSFNELTLNQAGLPHNPMINAGAIMSASLIKPELPMAERFDYLVNLVSTLSGGKRPGFNNAVYHSEKETADRNFALAHYMRELKAFPENVDIHQALDLYFSACSMEITVTDLAKIAATMANGGVDPFTADAVFSEATVKNSLSMMNIAGMYDYSGEFAFRIGMPAKSGVSGAIMAVVPNVMGIAVWSPRLDSYGNSVRGVEFLNRLVEKFNFHNYDSLVSSQKIDPRKKTPSVPKNMEVSVMNAVNCGDLYELKRLTRLGANLVFCDPDGETLLHIASAKGHDHVVEYLLGEGMDRNTVNKYDKTPMDVASELGHFRVIELLQQPKLLTRDRAQEQPAVIKKEAEFVYIPLTLKVAG